MKQPTDQMPIYLDNQATTPVDPAVLEEMMPYLTHQFGNPASINHAYGWQAGAAVDAAREKVAQLIGARAKEIVFTSGATESTNLALFGVFNSYDRAHLITSEIEHPATLLAARELESRGHDVTYLKVDSEGLISLEKLQKALTDKTIMVSLIHANNEIGTVQPIQQIGELLKSHKVYFHVDAAQSAGKIPFSVEDCGVHLLSLSGHKLHAPKGCGALYLRGKNPRVRLKPLMFGGGQERGMRSGTVNVASLVGLGKACEISSLEIQTGTSQIGALRDKMWAELARRIHGVQLNGPSCESSLRLPSNLNVLFPEVHRDLFMGNLGGLACSTGSACATGSTETSHVLKSIGRSSEESKRSLRFGFGRFTTEQEVLKASEIVVEAYKRSRKG